MRKLLVFMLLVALAAAVSVAVYRVYVTRYAAEGFRKQGGVGDAGDLRIPGIDRHFVGPDGRVRELPYHERYLELVRYVVEGRGEGE